MSDSYVWMDSLWLKDKYGKPNVILFGRDFNDRTKTITTIVKGFDPYFYAPAEAPTGIFRSTYGNYRVEASIYTDALGRQVRKVITDLPSLVPKIRDLFTFTDEADILFDKRFVTDRGIRYGYRVEKDGSPVAIETEHPIEPRVLWFDIEVKGKPGEIPLPTNPVYPIVSIQCMDSYTEKIKVFTFGVPRVHDDQVVCDSEEDLLIKFAAHVKSIDPDILSGWYTNSFDIPYIICRGNLLGVPLRDLCRTYQDPSARNEGFKWFIRVPGRQCFDLLDGFKKYWKPKGELSSYDLKSVIANKDVMEDAAFSYTDYGDRINELFASGRWSDFVDYCRFDVIALATIDKKLKLIAFYEHLRMVAGVKIEETLMNSRVVESLIMRAGIKPMPTKSYDKKAGEKFDGAVVLTPPVGVHSGVGVVDLTALYPNIMVGFNISPDIDGVVANTVKVIMEERDKLRNKPDKTSIEKNKETVLKYLANSFYGVIGWPMFRLYNRDQAGEITRIGRELNRYLQEITRECGLEPIYGDTDSIFIRGIRDPLSGVQLQVLFNDRLAQWSDRKGSRVHFTLKFEKFYRRIIFKKAVSGEVAKKRYAGHLIWKDGKDKDELDFTGIEIKRSDQANITKDLVRKFLTDVLISDDTERAVSDVRAVRRSVLSGECSVHDVSIPKGVKDLSRNDPWARGVHVCKELFGVNIPQGIKPRLIYIRGTNKELCITPDMDEDMICEGIQVDWGTCCAKTVEKKMKTFVESIGYSWDEQINGQRTLI